MHDSFPLYLRHLGVDFAEMDRAITEEELDWAIMQTDPSTARGLNGMSIEDISHIRKEDLLRVVNGVFQWAPEAILRGRITLIQKVNNPQQQGDFRPISPLCCCSVVTQSTC